MKLHCVRTALLVGIEETPEPILLLTSLPKTNALGYEARFNAAGTAVCRQMNVMLDRLKTDERHA